MLDINFFSEPSFSLLLNNMEKNNLTRKYKPKSAMPSQAKSGFSADHFPSKQTVLNAQ